MEIRIYKWIKDYQDNATSPGRWQEQIIECQWFDNSQKNTIVINDHLKLYKKNFFCHREQLNKILNDAKTYKPGSTTTYEI